MASLTRPTYRPGQKYKPARFIGDTDSLPYVDSVNPSFDRTAGGVAVTIRGRNFGKPDGATPTVRFGGTAATAVVVVNSTTITCNAPAHALGLVDIDVTNSHNQTGTLVDGFVYIEPQITQLIPNHGVLAGNETIIIEGGNFQAGATITFGGVAATNITFIDAQHYSCKTPAHAVGPVQVLLNTVVSPVPFFFTLLTRGDDIRRNPSISIQKTLGDTPSICTFQVDGRSAPPTAGEAVEITDPHDGDRELFSGVALSVDQDYEDDKINLVWNVSCSNYVYWLNRKRPFGVYLNTSVTDIVLDLALRYAPWVNTSFVQLSLCNVNVSFDGTKTFSECLSILARQLGGGHWYLIGKVLHFFHTVGGGGTLGPTQVNPSGVVEDGSSGGAQPGIGAAMTIAAGSTIAGSSYTPGFYIFRSSFVYSNGAESGMSLLSNVLFFNGLQFPDLSNIPLGVNPGGLTVTARRFYFSLYNPITGYANWNSLGFQIDDNTTTALSKIFSASLAASNPGVPLSANRKTPSVPVKTPPAGPAVAPGASLGGLSMSGVYESIGFHYFNDGVHEFVGTAGSWQFKISNVYADGTESQPSPVSGIVDLNGHQSVALTAPIGIDLNGVPVRYRRIYGILFQTAYGAFVGDLPGFTSGWWIIPDNTTIFTTIGQGFFFEHESPQQPGETTNPVDPCDGDGPYLEDTLTQPADVDDTNTELLRDPQVTSSVDVSQLRNRVFVRGAGTLTLEDAVIGAMTLSIADSSALAPNGGYVIIGAQGLQSRIAGLGTTIGEATIHLLEPLTIDLPTGSPIRSVAVANDLESQRMMGRIELDDDGNQTDGVHEFYIDDLSLTTYQQQINRAIAELELFGRPTVHVSYGTRDVNTEPGRKVTFALSNPPIRGDFLIQAVTIDQIHDESDTLKPRRIASASSVKFELDDLLLMIASASSGFSTSSFSSPGTGIFIGSSPAGIKEGAVATAKTYTDTQVAAINTPVISPVAGPVTLYGVYMTIDFTAARQMNSVPIQLVPAVPGKVVVPIYGTFEQNITGTTYSGNWVNTFVHEGLIVSLLGSVSTSNGLAPRTFWGPFPGVGAGTQDGINVSAANRGLFLKGSTDVTNGSGNIRVGVIYALIDALT